MAKQLQYTYNEFLNYRTSESSIPFALSEYIDNSISSYTDDGFGSCKGLNIEIDYSYGDDKVSYTIKDNAKGMTDKELEEAMQPGSKVGESRKDSYNQYGVGMKLATFFLGKTLRIWTKKRKDKEYYLEVIIDNDKIGQNVVVEAVTSKDNLIKGESGTVIEVSDIYDSRKLTDKKADELERGLGWRYSGLIKEGLMIDLKRINEDKKVKDKLKTIEEYRRTSLNVPVYIKEKKQTGTEQKKSDLINDLNKVKLKNDFQKLFLADLLERINSNSNLEFVYEFELDNEKAKINWGLFPKAIGAESGISVKHKSRYIIHGPNFKGLEGQKGCLPFSVESSGGNNHYRWMWGEIDLTGLNQTPDRNKQKIAWTGTGEQDLEKAMKKIWADTKEITLVLKNHVESWTKSKAYDPKKISQSVPKGSEKMVNKMSNIDEQLIFDVSGNKFKANVSLEEGIESAIDMETISGDEISVKASIHHPFWEWLLRDIHTEKLKQEIIYKVSSILGFTQRIIDKAQNEELMEEFADLSFVQLLDAIVKGKNK